MQKTMIHITRLELDVLKPHHPDILEFAKGLAELGEEWSVRVNVLEMDEQTETLQAIIEGPDIQLEPIVSAINEMGGSLHSIDGVNVVNLCHTRKTSK